MSGKGHSLGSELPSWQVAHPATCGGGAGGGFIARHAFTHTGTNTEGEYQAITPSGSPVYSNAPEDYFSSLEGAKHYELKNHLGNVLATVSDKRDVEVDGSNNVESYTAKISDVSFYYPFGSLMPGLSDFGGGHWFGFQGQQKDNEVRNVNGSHIDFKYRPYNADLGRFWKVDPLASKYPFYSPYAFSGNRVIDAVELEGLEPQLLKKQIPIEDNQFGRNWGYGGKQGASEKTDWKTVVNDKTLFQVVQCMNCMGPSGERPLIWYKVDEHEEGDTIVVPPVMVQSGTLDSHKPLDETVDRVVNSAKGMLPELKEKYGQGPEDVSSVHVDLPDRLSKDLRGPVREELKGAFPNANISVWDYNTSDGSGTPGHGGTAESTPFQVSIQGSPKKEGGP